VRQVEFNASLGLLLNGQAVKIKGMCNHQDMGGLGVAVPDSLQVKLSIKYIHSIDISPVQETLQTDRYLTSSIAWSCV
jgi:hypothetical protein